jgi:predicted esterase
MKIFIPLVFLSFVALGCQERHQTIPYTEAVLTEGDMEKTAKFGTVDQILDDYVYHQSTDVENDDNTKCTFDLYRPSKLKGKTIPLVIVLHEGAFLTGDKTDFVSESLSKDLCRSGGFAVANCNYPLLRSPRVLFDKSFTHKKINEAIADIRLAVQYFREKSTDYLIDSSKIYVCGWSAGAILANHLVFSDLDESLDYNAKNRHVDFNNSDAYATDLKLAGVISIGGGLLSKCVDDADVAKTRLLLIHGELDDIIPIGFGPPLQRFRNAQSIDLGGISMGVEDNKGNEHSTTVKLKIPAWITRTSIDLLTTKMYGSAAIFDLTPSNNVTLLEIKNGGHSFFLTKGRLNKTYTAMRKKMIQFINK